MSARHRYCLAGDIGQTQICGFVIQSVISFPVNFSSEKARKALNASLPSAREERGTVLNISFTFMVVGTHVIWLDCLFMFCTLQVKMCYLSVSLTYDI